MTAVALAESSLDKAKAEEMAKDIEYPELQDEVLASIAFATLAQGDDEVKKAMDKIVEPRFAKSKVLYVKAKALCRIADAKAGTDVEGAKKYYGKAAGAAAEAKSPALQWKITANLCKIDPDRLFDMAGKIEGDDTLRATTLSDIAAEWAAKGDSRASVAWDLATKAASGIDDKPKSCAVLRGIASKCAQYDKTRASAIFTKAVEKASKIDAIIEG